MRLICRCFVIVKSKVRLAGRRVHADRIADQNFTLAALTQLRTFRLVLAIQPLAFALPYVLVTLPRPLNHTEARWRGGCSSSARSCTYGGTAGGGDFPSFCMFCGRPSRHFRYFIIFHLLDHGNRRRANR